MKRNKSWEMLSNKGKKAFRVFVGIILLGWGIVQVGMSFSSHDPSQRSNGFLTLAGGVVITFAREILNLIMGA